MEQVENFEEYSEENIPERTTTYFDRLYDFQKPLMVAEERTKYGDK